MSGAVPGCGDFYWLAAEGPMKSFFQQVYDVVRSIPPGRVMSYGQVAAAIGAPQVSPCGFRPETMRGTSGSV